MRVPRVRALTVEVPESSLDADGERKGSFCASLPDYWRFNLVDGSSKCTGAGARFRGAVRPALPRREVSAASVQVILSRLQLRASPSRISTSEPSACANRGANEPFLRIAFMCFIASPREPRPDNILVVIPVTSSSVVAPAPTDRQTGCRVMAAPQTSSTDSSIEYLPAWKPSPYALADQDRRAAHLPMPDPPACSWWRAT